MKKTNSVTKVVKTLPYAASACMGVAKLVDSASKLSEKPKGQQQSALKNVGYILLGIVGSIALGKWLWDKSSAKKYRKEKLADADAKVIEIVSRGPKCKDIEEDDDEYIEEEEEDIDTPTPSFIDWFQSQFSMPPLPPFLAKIIKGVPKGYEIPMLLHLLCMLGAICFSRIRAKYLDKKLHASNLQVIIEGNWGSGKAKFDDLYNSIFSRIIERSNELISRGESGHIIQTTGIGTTMAKYIDILAENQGCHMYLFNSELNNMARDMKKENGLNFETLRCAYENGPIGRYNRSKAAQGFFPVYLNFTFTGTPAVVFQLFKNEIEDGTVSRICFTSIPDAGRELQSMNLPTVKELEDMKDQIDEWKEKYCFTESQEGDKAVEEQEIDLSYVLKPLKEWLGKQYDLAQQEDNPARSSFRGRAANNAFRCAMILHMLWGQPGKDSPKRQYVIDGALYIANYCEERLLHKFGKEQNEKIRANKEAECVENLTQSSEPASQSEKITDIAELSRLHSIKDEKGNNKYGWDKLADMSGIPASTLRLKVKAYEDRYKGGKHGVQEGC